MRLRKLISTHELIWQGADDELHFRIEIFEEQGESCLKLFGRVFRCDTYKVLPTWIQSEPSRSPQTADESWFVLDGMFDGRGRQMGIAPPQIVAQRPLQDDRVQRPVDLAAVQVAIAQLL